MTLLHHVTSRWITVLIIALVFNDEYVKAGKGGVGVFNIAELIIFISSQLKFLPGGTVPPLPPPPRGGIISGRKRKNVWVNNIQPVMESGFMDLKPFNRSGEKEASMAKYRTPSVRTLSISEGFYLFFSDDFLDIWQRPVAPGPGVKTIELWTEWDLAGEPGEPHRHRENRNDLR